MAAFPVQVIAHPILQGIAVISQVPGLEDNCLIKNCPNVKSDNKIRNIGNHFKN